MSSYEILDEIRDITNCPDGKSITQHVSALRAKVAELENELSESARLHGKGGEREAALITRATRAEAERDALQRNYDKVMGQYVDAANRRDEARAKCERMEWARGSGCWTCGNAGDCSHHDNDGNVLNGGVCPHWTPPQAWEVGE